MEHKKKKSAIWLTISIVLMIISMIFASSIQSSWGTVDVKDLNWETQPGFTLGGYLFVPDGVSAENKAPAIVASHGMFNNREMQDANFVELSRRGYVVLAIDMPSHGLSENTPNIGGVLEGMYEAVRLLGSLDYVDADNIGVTGHSLGGWSCNTAVMADEEMGTNLISAVLLNCYEPIYANDDDEFFNLYGNRDVGVVAAQYDEFFMSHTGEDGNPTAPRDYVTFDYAQSFLHFGTDPSELEARLPETLYRETIDGEEAVRVIYNPAISHPWSHFSKISTTNTIDFFEETLGAPNPIPSNNQVWQWKEFFNLVGFIGFGIFVVNFAILMAYTSFFSSLRAKKLVEPREFVRGGRVWFWATLIVGSVFGAAIFLPVMNNVNSFTFFRDPWPQSSPWGIGCWAAISGVFMLLCLFASYYFNAKKQGVSLSSMGTKMSLVNLGKTALLGLIVVTVSYACVFFADFFFMTDFRIWIMAVKPFDSRVVTTAIFPYAVLFLIYFISVSVVTNTLNYNTLGAKDGKRKWINTAIVALFNTMPILILLAIQYITFFVTGNMVWTDPGSMFVLWLISVAFYVPLTTIMTRKIYRATNNPYLGGIINGLILTLIFCSNTLTWA